MRTRLQAPSCTWRQSRTRVSRCATCGRRSRRSTGILQQRLLPAVSELGIGGEPEIRIVPLHNLYAADPDMIDRIGAVSLPAAVASWAS